MLLLNSNALKENAKDFISLSCEEFQTNDGKKIKAAICNIYRGLLLLLKAYILQKTENLYDDLFIYEAKIYGLDGESQLTLNYKSDKTLNRKSIFETIKKLKILPQEDVCRLVGLKEDLAIIARKRNELEHAHIDHPETQLRYVFFMAYKILKDLLEIFRQDINEFLGSDCEAIEKKYQDYEKMKNKKKGNFRNEDRKAAQYLRCVECGSDDVVALKPQSYLVEDSLSCNNCHKEFNINGVIEDLFKIKNFKESHAVIGKFFYLCSEVLVKLNNDQKEKILKAFRENDQIYRIITDEDIELIYKKIQRVPI